MEKNLSGTVDGVRYEFSIEADGYWNVKINGESQSVFAQSLSGDLADLDDLQIIIEKIKSSDGWAGDIASYSKSEDFIFIESLIFKRKEERYTDAQVNKILQEWYSFIQSKNA